MKRPFLLLLIATGCAAPGGPTGIRRFSERLLATIPEGVNVVVPPVFSNDGRHAAYVARTPEDARVVQGETKGKPHGVL